MVLASACVWEAFTPLIIFKMADVRGGMPLKRALARTMASAFWWWIMAWQRLLESTFCVPYSVVPRRYTVRGALAICVLRYILLVPYYLTKLKVFKTVIKQVYGHVWHVVAWNIIRLMGLSPRNESILVFVCAVVVLLVLTRGFRLLN
jgi:hypothetical protein